MPSKLCFLILTSSLVGFSARGIASQNNKVFWLVQPTVCIVQTLGDRCNIDLDVVLPRLTKGQYCYYQDSTLLSCFFETNPILKLSLNFSENTLLELKNGSEETVFEQVLEIRTREKQKKTRRVRNPWRFF